MINKFKATFFLICIILAFISRLSCQENLTGTQLEKDDNHFKFYLIEEDTLLTKEFQLNCDSWKNKNGSVVVSFEHDSLDLSLKMMFVETSDSKSKRNKAGQTQKRYRKVINNERRLITENHSDSSQVWLTEFRELNSYSITEISEDKHSGSCSVFYKLVLFNRNMDSFVTIVRGKGSRSHEILEEIACLQFSLLWSLYSEDDWTLRD